MIFVRYLILGPFHYISPNEFNPTPFNFDEIWHTCWLSSHSPKSRFLARSAHWAPSYGLSKFEILGQNGRGHWPLTSYISQTTGSILMNFIFLERGCLEDSRSILTFKIGHFLMTLTLEIIFDLEIWPCCPRLFQDF